MNRETAIEIPEAEALDALRQVLREEKKGKRTGMLRQKPKTALSPTLSASWRETAT